MRKMKLAGILIGISLSIFILTGVARAVELDRIVAVVNDEVISWSELYRAMESEVLRRSPGITRQEKAIIFKENESRFLEGMIDTRIQLQEAKRFGLDVVEAEVDSAIEGIRKRNNLSEEEFIGAIGKESLSLDAFKKIVAEDILISKLVERQVRTKVSVSEEEINAYIAENSGAIGAGGPTARIRMIFLKKPVDPDGIKKTAEKASKVYTRVMSGEDFGKVAIEVSEDPSSKSGGDLGFVKVASMMNEFQRAIKSISTGQIAKPFETAIGYYIVKLEDFKDISSRQIVGSKIYEEKMAKEHRKWLKGLRDSSFIEVRM